MDRPLRRLAGPMVMVAVAVLLTSCSARSGDDPSGAPPRDPGTAAASTHDGHGMDAEVPPAAPLRDGERFVNLTMSRPYTPVARNGGTDQYRCFLVDPELTSRAFLTGSQFLPQNVDLVHHAIFFRLDAADANAARQLDAGDPGEGWTCFGDSGVGDAAWVAHWAPGANETLLNPGIGYSMPPGSLLVMQVHYNLLASQGEPGGADQSGIRLRLTDGRADLDPLNTELLPAPVELPCATGESGPLCDRATAIRDVRHRFGEHGGLDVDQLVAYCNSGRPPTASSTQRCDHRVTEPGTLHALAGHMHLLGRSIKVELNPGTDRARTLLDIPNYDFDQQAVRPLDTPVQVEPGDTYRVTCTHDATLRQRLPQLRSLPPRYVVWGEGTSDEMCLGLVVWSHRG